MIETFGTGIGCDPFGIASNAGVTLPPVREWAINLRHRPTGQVKQIGIHRAYAIEPMDLMRFGMPPWGWTLSADEKTS